MTALEGVVAAGAQKWHPANRPVSGADWMDGDPLTSLAGGSQRPFVACRLSPMSIRIVMEQCLQQWLSCFDMDENFVPRLGAFVESNFKLLYKMQVS